MNSNLPILKILQVLNRGDRLIGLIVLLMFLLFYVIIEKGLISQFSQVLGFVIVITLIFLLFKLALLSIQHVDNHSVDGWGFDAEKEKKFNQSLVFLEDEVSIRYLQEESAYKILFSKQILNNGEEPITRLYARIAVDVFPDDIKKAKEYYRRNPLEMNELNFKAYDENNLNLDYELEHDYDFNKELFIHFKSKGVLYPLYPGKIKCINYTFTISTKKWGPFIERNIRTVTEKCRVIIYFPENLNMVLWGTEKSITTGELPLMPSIDKKKEAGFNRYEWMKNNPTLYSRYRIRWQFPEGHEPKIE